jgi:AI-2 transport protein TqsA
VRRISSLSEELGVLAGRYVQPMTTHDRAGGRLDRFGPPGMVLPRALVLLLGAAALVVVLGGVRAVAWLIAPLLMALVIVICVAPVQTRLRRRGWPNWLTTMVTVVLVYGILLGISLGIVVSIARLAGLLPQYAHQASQLSESLTRFLAGFGVAPGQLRTAADSFDVTRLVPFLVNVLKDISGLATNLVFLLALLLFVAVEAGVADQRFAAIATDRPTIRDALSRFATGTRHYLLVTTIFGLIVAIADTIALAVIGIPLAITWGILSFVTNYIPNIGFLIGLAPPAVLGLLVGGPKAFVLVIVIYGVLNFVLQSLIQPRFVGDAVGLSTVVTFVSLVFWTWLLGPLGAILAVPATLLVKAVLVDIDPQARWAGALLSSQPGPERPAVTPTPRRFGRGGAPGRRRAR